MFFFSKYDPTSKKTLKFFTQMPKLFFSDALNWLKRAADMLIYMREEVDFLTEDSQTQNHSAGVGRVRKGGRVYR